MQYKFLCIIDEIPHVKIIQLYNFLNVIIGHKDHH